MTPEQSLKFLQPAFRNLFEKETPDLGRFLRLCIDVFDPDPGYGPVRCSGLALAIAGCGYVGVFHVAIENGNPYGYRCPQCNTVYPWAFTKSLKKRPSTIILTSDGSSTIGHCRAESDSGVTVTDA